MTKPVLTLLLLSGILWATDKKDTAVYRPNINFYGKQDTILSLDFSSKKPLREIDGYNPAFHFPPVRQDTTGTCWAFSATSFLESEIYRQHGKKIRLSRLFTVYWEYVEKVRRFVQQRGESLVVQGSQPMAVLKRMQQYGAVPADLYTGLVNGKTKHSHGALYKEIKTYLNYIKQNDLWQEEQVLANVKMILNRHLGIPPSTIAINGTNKTPVEYLMQDLQLPLDDYVAFVSFIKFPFWTKQPFPVPDNWWKSTEYINIPLPDFYAAVKSAINDGFTVVLAGDMSEPGKYGPTDLAVVPSYDIPSAYINQNAREFRFYNKTSTDDHSIHLVGYKKYAGEDWFLIKDSAASAFKGQFNGYFFFHGDYIKLKILAFWVHKDGAAGVLKRFADKNQKD
ncbi:peptidase C1 [candidate division KSB1 bacterium]|nr:peptidase C1 [candidate division KSB1 bacterium]